MATSKYYRRKFIGLLKAELSKKAHPVSYTVFINAVKRIEEATGINWQDIGSYSLTPGLPVYCERCHLERDTECGICFPCRQELDAFSTMESAGMLTVEGAITPAFRQAIQRHLDWRKARSHD
jgi:hypothetical protein